MYNIECSRSCCNPVSNPITETSLTWYVTNELRWKNGKLQQLRTATNTQEGVLSGKRYFEEWRDIEVVEDEDIQQNPSNSAMIGSCLEAPWSGKKMQDAIKKFVTGDENE